CRPGKQLLPCLGVGAQEDGFEQLPYGAEAEVALEDRPLRREDRHPVGRRPTGSLVEQRRLAYASRALDDEDAAVAREPRPDGLVHGLKLRATLDERSS